MLTIFVIQEGKEKNYWHRAGVAFKNKDGSFNIKIDLFPGVALQLREAKSDAAEGGDNARPERRTTRAR